MNINDDEQHPLVRHIHSLATTLATQHSQLHHHAHVQSQIHLLSRESSILKQELSSLRALESSLPTSTDSSIKINQLSLALRTINEKLEFTERVLLDRTKQLHHASADVSTAKSSMDAAYDLVSHLHAKEQELLLQLTDLQTKLRLEEQKTKSSEVVIQEYANLVRKLEGRRPSITPPPPRIKDHQNHLEEQNQITHLQTQLTTTQHTLSLLQTHLTAQTQTNQSLLSQLSDLQLELDKHERDDNTASKMVSRYMKFSQQSTNALQTTLTTLQHRHNTTLKSYSSQIHLLQSHLLLHHHPDPNTNNQIEKQLLHESFCRRLETKHRLHLLLREEKVVEDLKRWLRRSEERLSSIQTHHHHQRQQQQQQEEEEEDVVKKYFMEMIQDAKIIIDNIDNTPIHIHIDSLQQQQQQQPIVMSGSLARFVNVQSMVCDLLERLHCEQGRRMELEELVGRRGEEEEEEDDNLSEVEREEEDVHRGLVKEPTITERSYTPDTTDLSAESTTYIQGDDVSEVERGADEGLDVHRDLAKESTVMEELDERSYTTDTTDVLEELITHVPSEGECVIVELKEDVVDMVKDEEEVVVNEDDGSEKETGDDSQLESHPSSLPSPSLSNLSPPPGNGDDLRLEEPSPSNLQPPSSPLEPDPQSLPSPSHSNISPPAPLPSPPPGNGDDSQLGAEPPSLPSPSLSNLPPPLGSGDDSQLEAPSVSNLPPPSPPPSPPSPPPHPLLKLLHQTRNRYTHIQNSFHDCHIALENLKSHLTSSHNTTPINNKNHHHPNIIPYNSLRTIVQRLDDYTEDIRVELEIRILDEEVLGRGYETLLLMRGGAGGGEEEEGEILAFVNGTDPMIMKALKSFEKKLKDLEEDVAVVKKVVYSFDDDDDDDDDDNREEAESKKKKTILKSTPESLSSDTLVASPTPGWISSWISPSKSTTPIPQPQPPSSPSKNSNLTFGKIMTNRLHPSSTSSPLNSNSILRRTVSSLGLSSSSHNNTHSHSELERGLLHSRMTTGDVIKVLQLKTAMPELLAGTMEEEDNNNNNGGDIPFKPGLISTFSTTTPITTTLKSSSFALGMGMMARATGGGGGGNRGRGGRGMLGSVGLDGGRRRVVSAAPSSAGMILKKIADVDGGGKDLDKEDVD